MTTRSSLRLFAPLLFSLAVSSPAFAADEAVAARSAALRVEGNRLMDERKYEEAIARFEEALRLTPDEPALYYNLARVHDVRGDAVRAIDNMEQFLKRATPDLKARIPQLDQLAEDMRRKVARVRVVCTGPATVTNQSALSRAIVLADKQVVGTGCTTHEIRVRAGRVVFRAEAEGYVSGSVEAELLGGDSKDVAITLAPRDTSGILRLRTNPEHVNVRLGDRELGQSPVEIVLAAGSHTLQLSQTGYEDLSLPVVMGANTTRDVDATLEKTPSVFTRWWFWTGVGVVLATGVGIGVALSTERDPDRGTIAPGVARLPLSRW